MGREGDELQAVYLLPDREQRITARRARIAAALAARENEGKEEKNENVEEKKQLSHGELRVLQGRRNFSRLMAASDNKITAVRLAEDDAESKRRTEEEARRQELRQKMLQEAEQSSRENADVAARWANLYSVEVPQDLMRMIAQQREACGAIIASKDNLIADLKNDLTSKDAEYVKALKRQVEDIDALLRHMGDQVRELQGAAMAELTLVEESFLAERKALLEGNTAELDALFERSSKMETDFMEGNARRAEEFYASLEAQQAQDSEDFSLLKNRLETDIHNLEQHLEAMQATYQLNTEKLEYNYRVLVERDHENQNTIGQQKKKIARQRDLLSGLKAKYVKSDGASGDENTRLTDEYRRVTEQFKDLQTKFRHFEQADAKTYQRVLENNRDTCTHLVSKLLEGDRLIHTQQLGLVWNPPSEATFSDVSAAAAAVEVQEEEAAEAEEQRATVHDRLLDPRSAAVARLLCDEAGFLAEARVRGAVGDAAQPAEAVVLALGISDAADFDMLLARLSREGGSGVVEPEEVIRCLKAFVEEELRSMPTRRAHTTSAVPGARAARRDVYEQEYWERLSNVVSDRTCRIWSALDAAMLKYNKTLEQRSSALIEIQALVRQNTELRGLLDTYRGSKQAASLILPPM